jgi:hypothetical protein
VGRQTSSGFPAEGEADGLQDRDQPSRVAGIGCHEVWQARREDAAFAAPIPADEFPHYEDRGYGPYTNNHVTRRKVAMESEVGGHDK